MEQFMQKLASIEAAAAAQCNYAKTLALLQALKAGTVSLDEVNVMPDGWTVSAVVPAEEPAQAEEPTPVEDSE